MVLESDESVWRSSSRGSSFPETQSGVRYFASPDHGTVGCSKDNLFRIKSVIFSLDEPEPKHGSLSAFSDLRDWDNRFKLIETAQILTS